VNVETTEFEEPIVSVVDVDDDETEAKLVERFPPGTWLISVENGLLGETRRFHKPGTFRRSDDEPFVPSWCIEFTSGDVALWPGDWAAVTPQEHGVVGGAIAGIGALFKGVLAQARANKVKPARAIELIMVALQTHVRATQVAIEKSREA